MRFAILGCGSIGRRHLGNLLALGEFDIWVYEPVSKDLPGIVSQFGVNVTDKLDDIWDATPDVVLITAPSNLHLDLALVAARNGCHIFIEKPLAHTSVGLKELLLLVKKKGLITMVGCNMRFHPGPKKIKEWLTSGRIGCTHSARLHTGSYLPDWRPNVDYHTVYSASSQNGGGAIFDQIHELDLAYWFFGSLVSVKCLTINADWLDLKVEGIVEILGLHTNGMMSSIHLNFVQRDYHRSIQIIGEEGSLFWDFNVPEVRCYTPQKKWEKFDINESWEINQMYLEEMTHFLTCLAHNTPTCCPVDDGAQVLEVALAAKVAARENRAIQIGG